MLLAMPYGAPAAQVVNLNVDSLWNGGPFGADVCRSSGVIVLS